MRMIERWFPCAEVSDASERGWGSGQSEKALFVWFATRPLAQARAAVLTSLLPWPESIVEQQRLQDLVRAALTGYDAAHKDLVEELARAYPNAVTTLDPFSGRGVIPLEAASLGVRAWGFDYSPIATLAGQLLADYPFRDWTGEPDLPFPIRGVRPELFKQKLLQDVRLFLDEVGCRFQRSMSRYYPEVDGKRAWGYLWAVTLPCQECGRRFPLTSSLVLRHPLARRSDRGQSYRIEVDKGSGCFRAVLHDGPPTSSPTLVNLTRGEKALRGKVAVCPFCQHVHQKDTHTRLAMAGLFEDTLLVVADDEGESFKRFREPAPDELRAVSAAEEALAHEPVFGASLSAVPNEPIPPGNNDTVRPSSYGSRTYGDLCNARQTLGFVRLCRATNDVAKEAVDAGLSQEYVAALAGYAGSVIVRKLKYSTRGAALQAYRDQFSNRLKVAPLFRSEASIPFAHDYFETGLTAGPGSWPSLVDGTLAVLRAQLSRAPGRPATIRRGSALSLPLRDSSVSAVVTDPPYDDMIDYSDASDLFFVWLKRALHTSHVDFGVTADPNRLQEKTDEIIVKRGGSSVGDHRTQSHYDDALCKSFAEAARVVRPDGVVTIVFGHGDPEVWHRLLTAITGAGLVLTGSWPARTESGGNAGSANIVTTLTLACRRAAAERPSGRVNEVDAEVRNAVRARVPLWEASGLALTDQLMASAGPAMEVVGRYGAVLDRRGDPIELDRYLILARRAVEETAAIRIEDLPLETFDSRTRFALFWTRVFGRSLAPKSEARWQFLAADLSQRDLAGLLIEAEKGKGVRLVHARETAAELSGDSATIDVVLALARAWNVGLPAVGEVLAASGRGTDDQHLWAALTYLSSRLPEADPDRIAWSGLVRAKRSIGVVMRGALASRRNGQVKERQGRLFAGDPVFESEEA